MRFFGIVIILIPFLYIPSLSAQSWRWAKDDLIIEGIPTLAVKSCIDSRGNTILLSSKLDRLILSKHDASATVLWKRELFPVSGISTGSLPNLCVDDHDNIYLGVAALSKIDNTPISMPSPFGIIKFNASGRFRWSKNIDYTPFIFAPKIVSNNNRIFFSLTIKPFESLTYDGITYNNPGANTSCSFIASIDTSGKLQWSKRMYSPAQPITCNASDVAPELSINLQSELLLVGIATDKLKVDSTYFIDYPYNCRNFVYGMVINGNTGTINWAKELTLDSLTSGPNVSVSYNRPFSTILTNGYSVIHRYLTKDTALTTPNQKTLAVSSKIYLFDNNGDPLRKDSMGSVNPEWYQMFQLVRGDEATFYSTGVRHSDLNYTETFEVRKWDSQLNILWSKGAEFNRKTPHFSSTHLYYRNHVLNMLLQTGSESNNLVYAYFGADSLRPYLENLYARMTDGTNYIAGTVFFDQNQNGIRDAGEPPAPNVLIADANGNTVQAATNANGYYEIRVNPGAYSIKPVNLRATYPNHQTFSPASYSVTIDGFGNYIRNKNFGLSPCAAITDGQVTITAAGRARPGAFFGYRAVVSNPGANDFTGTYYVQYDTTLLIYQYSQLPPESVTPGQIIYNMGRLAANDIINNEIIFQVKTTARLGDTLITKARLTTNPNDVLPINNKDSSCILIRTSFDPNQKEVFPFQDVPYDSVITGSQELDYTIQFQNTGNDTAFAVTVTDTLSDKLDLATLRVIGSSHPATIAWTSPNIAGFYFPDIQLPDSATNTLKSNGFIRFKIKPKSTVALSDLVINTSTIFFDYNDPVKTNDVSTTFSRIITIPGTDTTISTDTTLYDRDLQVRPVPASGTLNFRVTIPDFNEKMNVSLYDASGRIMIVSSRQVTGNIYQSMDISRVSAGIYYLLLNAPDRRFIKKVLIQ